MLHWLSVKWWDNWHALWINFSWRKRVTNHTHLTYTPLKTNSYKQNLRMGTLEIIIFKFQLFDFEVTSFIHSFIYWLVRSFVHSFVRSVVRSFIHPFFHSFIYYIYSFFFIISSKHFIHPSSHSFIHSMVSPTVSVLQATCQGPKPCLVGNPFRERIRD